MSNSFRDSYNNSNHIKRLYQPTKKDGDHMDDFYNPSKEDIDNLDQNSLKLITDFDLDNVVEVDSKDCQCVFETSKLINKLLHFICENIVGREEVVCQSFYAFNSGRIGIFSII